MKYLHTMVRVTDIDASLKFYCDALGLTANRCPEKGARWFLDSAGEFGECTLVDGPEIVLGCYGSGHR